MKPERDLRDLLSDQGATWPRPSDLPGFDAVAPEHCWMVQSLGWRQLRASFERDYLADLRPDLEDRAAHVEAIRRMVITNEEIMHAQAEATNDRDVEAIARRFRDAAASFAFDLGDWLVSGTAAVINERLVITALHVDPNPTEMNGDAVRPRKSPDPDGVTTSLLRSVSPTRIVEQLRRDMADAPSWAEARRLLMGKETDLRRIDADRLAQAVPLSALDRRSRDVAEAFLAHQEIGAGVYQRLTKHLGRPVETIRTWVAVAERDEWLTKGDRGRRNRRPGRRLQEYRRTTSVIDEEDEDQ